MTLIKKMKSAFKETLRPTEFSFWEVQPFFESLGVTEGNLNALPGFGSRKHPQYEERLYVWFTHLRAKPFRYDGGLGVGTEISGRYHSQPAAPVRDSSETSRLGDITNYRFKIKNGQVEWRRGRR